MSAAAKNQRQHCGAEDAGSQYTEEQQSIIDSSAKRLVVNAYAGTGKTTTLIGYALARPKQRILFLAYNKAIAQDAQRRFPGNVQCKTAHGLAYATEGVKFKTRLGNLRAAEVRDVLKTTAISAKLAISELERFFSSNCLSPMDLPPMDAVGFAQIKVIQDLTMRLWDEIQKPDSKLNFPHDAYLKLYQMKGPQLDRSFDIIMVDEAQDLNPVTLKIVEGQSAKLTKVYVGDKYQNIYTFRGSRNAMDFIERDETLTLTQSFRFGSEIANLASTILSATKNERQKVLGLNSVKSKIEAVNTSLPYTVLCRTNAGLFNEAVGLLMKDKSLELGFAGGVASMPFGRLEDIYKLDCGLHGEIKDGLIRKMKTVDEAQGYASLVEDVELASSIKTYKKYGRDTPRWIETIKARAVDESVAHVILSTAHRSKGLEWRQVCLSTDFPQFVCHDTKIKSDSREFTIKTDAAAADEANLVYVACTRATHRLEIPASVKNLISYGEQARDLEDGFDWIWRKALKKV